MRRVNEGKREASVNADPDCPGDRGASAARRGTARLKCEQGLGGHVACP